MTNKLVRVQRSRHGWEPGYFADLVGHRIPFASPDPEHPDPETGMPMVGLLMNVKETKLWISLIFHDVEREQA